jgi:hypothetical protein
LQLAKSVINSELDRVRLAVAAIDAQIAATPETEKDALTDLKKRRRAKEADLIFGDLEAHAVVEKIGSKPLVSVVGDEAEVRVLPIRHDAFVKLRLPVLLDHAKRDGTLMDIFGHLDALEPKAEVVVHFPPEVEAELGKATAWKGEPLHIRKSAPKIRIESYDAENVGNEEKLLTVFVMDLGEKPLSPFVDLRFHSNPARSC